jgi:PadR family transcriptional regulator, regulatory protein PadR
MHRFAFSPTLYYYCIYHYMQSTYCLKTTIERFIEPCILFSLSEEKSYGYDLLNKLRNTTRCKVNSGGLYRTLLKMEQGGLIEYKTTDSEIGPDKKVYQITVTGKLALDAWIACLEEQQKTISNLVNKYKTKQNENNKQ